jgi:hypothetical protein
MEKIVELINLKIKYEYAQYRYAEARKLEILLEEIKIIDTSIVEYRELLEGLE